MTLLKAFMIVTFAEATSWLGLLAAMILKYGFDNPTGVSIMGPIHGALFLAFAALLTMVHFQYRWPLRKTAISFLESIPPFTGFLLGMSLRHEVETDQAGHATTA